MILTCDENWFHQYVFIRPINLPGKLKTSLRITGFRLFGVGVTLTGGGRQYECITDQMVHLLDIGTEIYLELHCEHIWTYALARFVQPSWTKAQTIRHYFEHTLHCWVLWKYSFCFVVSGGNRLSTTSLLTKTTLWKPPLSSIVVKVYILNCCIS